MSLLNIGGSIDPCYRYKMPSICTKIEGNGNGIKTVILNGEDVSKSLNRPWSHILKFLGYELGSQTHIDTKNNKSI